jgi:adenylate cyclase
MTGRAAEEPTALRKLRHDLRTPLGQIIGYAEMLQEEAEERGLADFVPDLERIRSAARQLVQAVDRVFEAGPIVPPVDAPGGPAASEPAPDDAPADQAAQPSTGNLLVVDDEPRNRDVLARRLERRGYRVSVAADGRSALHALEREEFDLVVLDVLMPGMSGLEVLETIRRTRTAAELPVIMATALDRSTDTVNALELGANDYVTKPIDLPVVLARVEAQLRLKRAARQIEALARRLEIQSGFIRDTFGRYVSDEVVADLFAKPAGLDLRGERRNVTILMSDLRGFSSLTQTLEPAQIVALLNNYLGSMAEVIQSYRGTIDEFIGDAILAFFGAPVSAENDAERAVACALAMQLAVPHVNETNRRHGLPEIEMGIGIATGEVVVGNIGSEKRTKYGAVGSAVNLAARIEGLTLGGEIWVDSRTREALGDMAGIEDVRLQRRVGQHARTTRSSRPDTGLLRRPVRDSPYFRPLLRVG